MNADLHPEDLIERARQGLLTTDERLRLGSHLRACAACALEHRSEGDFAEDVAVGPLDAAVVARIVSGAMSEEAVPIAPRRSAASGGMRRLVAAGVLGLVAASAAAAVYFAVGRREPPPAHRPAPPARREAPVERPLAAPVEVVAPAPSPVAPVAPLRPRRSMDTRSTTSPDVVLPAEPVTAAPPGEAEPTAAELYAAANRARRSGQDVEAARLYLDLEARFPTSREAVASHVSLGRLLLDKRGDPRGALARFERYLGAQPRGTLAEEALVGRAVCLERLGRTAEARAAWEVVAREHPTSVHATRARERIEALQ